MQTTAAYWRNPQVRGYFYQFVLIAAIILGGWYLWHNTLLNMESRGIRTGFDFLGSEAGFQVLFSPFIAFDGAIHSYGRVFLVGVLNTLLVSVIGIISATIVGFIIGIARLSPNWLMAKLASVYIEIFRNLPLLLQIIFWYFILNNLTPSVRESVQVGDAFFLNVKGITVVKPIFTSGAWVMLIGIIAACIGVWFLRRWAKHRQEQTGKQFPTFWAGLGIIIATGIICFFISGRPISLEYPEMGRFRLQGGLTLIPELTALWFALTIYTAAFIAETVRSGIQAVPHGQTEAAQSLGLKYSFTLRFVVLPQALRVIIPPLISQYLNLTKNSSLATAIGYPDVVAVFAGTALNQSGKAVEIIAMTMAVYLFISLSISLLMNIYNKRKMLVER